MRARLRPRLERTISEVVTHYPQISGRIDQAKAGYERFNLMATFAYDRVKIVAED